MKTQINNTTENLAALTKDVTFRLPAHIADMIESTRLQLDGQWEEWAASLATSALDHPSFAGCAREFEDLAVDSSWTFDSATDRASFMTPLLMALKTAHARHHAANRV